MGGPVSAFIAPIRRKDTAKGHHYVDATGARVPGVTTILGDGVPKPALINWAANATAEAAVNRWDEIAAMPPANRLKTLQGARYAEKDAAANRGTAVHGFAEQLVQGHPVQVPDELAGHVEAYARFLDEFGVKPVHVEFSVASYRHGYAGTGDLIADITHAGTTRRLLMDIKTNRSGIYGETALQLAAYRYADVLLPASGPEVEMPEVDGCAAIHVRADGYSLIPVTAGIEQHRMFLYAQQVAGFTKHSSDLVGAAVAPPTTSTFRLIREA
jgi:hypothetical protein